MAIFEFRAVDLAGVPSRGDVEASSKTAVTEQLRQRGLIVLDVSERREAFKLESIFQRFKSVKARPLAIFSRQFATLIASGMPMLRSLYTLEDQTDDEMLKKSIVAVRQDVEAGSSVAQAMEAQPGVFDPLYRSMVQAGEGSGRLEAGSRPRREPARAPRRSAPPGPLGDDVPAGGPGDRVARDGRGLRVRGPRLHRHLHRDRRGDARHLEPATAPDADHGRDLRLHHQQVVHPDPDHRGNDLRVQPLEVDGARQDAVGQDEAPVPGAHRRHRPQGRARALVAHLRGNHLLRRARCSRRSRSRARLPATP